MIETAANKIVQAAMRNGYVQYDRYDEYVYAIQLLLNIFANDITMIAIGLAMKMPLECIVFAFIYKVLRKYCGGYHFSTFLKCYISSVIMWPVTLLIVKYVPYHVLNWSVISISSVGILLWLSPVEAVNKPLDEKEASVFGNVAKIIILLLSAVYVMSCVMNLSVLAKIICLGLFGVSVFVAIGKIQLIYLRKNNIHK